MGQEQGRATLSAGEGMVFAAAFVAEAWRRRAHGEAPSESLARICANAAADAVALLRWAAESVTEADASDEIGMVLAFVGEPRASVPVEDVFAGDDLLF